MAAEESIAQAIGREISPHRRLVRSLGLYSVVLITLLAIFFSPRDPAMITLICLAGLNLIVITNYAEEAANKWKISET